MLLSIGLSLFLMILIMSLLWLFYLKTNRASYVDVIWSWGFLIPLSLSAFFLNAWWPRKLLLGSMMGLWSLRLGTHIFLRLKREHEDKRYEALKKEWQQNPRWQFFKFYQIQAVTVVLLSTPVFTSFSNTTQQMSLVEICAALLWLISWLGESLADHQLERFRKNPENKGMVCDQGLWAYSRHPNYFCEWLMWVSYALFALASTWGFLALISPALMYYFLVHVTGVKMAEEQSLQSKPIAYKKYQERVPAFFPIKISN